MKKSKIEPAPDTPPPPRNGVGPSRVVLPEGPWLTIAEFLVHRFPAIPRQIWMQRLQSGGVLDSNGAVVDERTRYRAQARIYYFRELPSEPRIPFDEVVLFQDELLVVADKPHFLPVIPSGRYVRETLLVRLKHKLGIDTLSPIHRIDRETAGLVVFTVRPETRSAYQNLFLHQSIQKRYEAIAPPHPGLEFPLTRRSRLEDDPENFMKMRETAGEPNSETRFELLGTHGEWARYGITPVTGRKHQIRVHCAAMGIPIRHDQIYPSHLPENTDDYAKPLQLLARSIAFCDPITAEPRRFTSARALEF